MKSAAPCVLTVNGGSSSIRFAVYEVRGTPHLRLSGKIDRIGVSGTHLIVNGVVVRRLGLADHHRAGAFLLDWLQAQPICAELQAVGHRVVHGLRHSKPERITAKLLVELRRITPYDPEHLPRAIALIEAFRER